jgi:rhomboid-like protein
MVREKEIAGTSASARWWSVRTSERRTFWSTSINPSRHAKVHTYEFSHCPSSVVYAVEVIFTAYILHTKSRQIVHPSSAVVFVTMSLLRPSCAVLARRLCFAQTQLEITRSPLQALLQSRRSLRPQFRPLSTGKRCLAKVVDTPTNPSMPHVPKRTVRIGQLPNGRVDERTIRQIFGPKLSSTDGNNVLRILHHRRTAGSLADYGVDNLGKQFTHVKRDVAMKGLEWLREQYPIDEARAAEEWADKEANRIQYELWLADPETESKYKDPARAFREQMQKEEKEKEQKEYDNRKIGILHAGKSQFELNIEEKRRQRLEEVTRVAEEKEKKEIEMEEKLASGEWVRTPTGTQLMKPGQTTYVDVFGREQISRRKEEAEKYQQESQTEFTSTEEMLSKTTLVNAPSLSFIVSTKTNTPRPSASTQCPPSSSSPS